MGSFATTDYYIYGADYKTAECVLERVTSGGGYESSNAVGQPTDSNHDADLPYCP
jgi:hypothetical protein